MFDDKSTYKMLLSALNLKIILKIIFGQFSFWAWNFLCGISMLNRTIFFKIRPDILINEHFGMRSMEYSLEKLVDSMINDLIYYIFLSKAHVTCRIAFLTEYILLIYFFVKILLKFSLIFYFK